MIDDGFDTTPNQYDSLARSNYERDVKDVLDNVIKLEAILKAWGESMKYKQDNE